MELNRRFPGLVALMLALAAPSAALGGIVLSADGGYDVGGALFTLDPEANSPGARGITDARELRQSFQLADSLDVEELVLSVALNGTAGDLVLRVYQLADVTAGTWSAGTLVHSLTVPTGGTSSGANLRLSLSGADVFFLPARNAGTTGYGIELTQSAGGGIGSIRHSNTGSDLFAPGNYYTETGNAGSSGGSPNTTRDLGLSIAGSTVDGEGDRDEDGLDDRWEDRHFGDDDGIATDAELELEDGAGDPDGDGFDNEAEETAATDPNDGLAHPGGGAVFYVAPDGDDAAPGSIDEPFATIGRAQQAAAPGTTVYFRGGTHAIDVGQVDEYTGIFARVFLMNKSGTAGNPIRYWAYPGEEPVIDMTAVNPAGYRIYTFYVTADWLHFRGLTVTGVQVNITTHTQSICFDNEGSHNLYERLVLRDNQAIGMWIGNGRDNLVLHCDAYRNWDYTSEGGVGGNVDGFGCHASADEGNVFRGCRAWLNSDDGFDLINVDHAVLIEDCWAAYNGYSEENGSLVSRGDGTGFKAGGYGKPPSSVPSPIPRHVVRGCLAVGNKQNGFYANHHPGGLDFIANTALRNRRNFNLLNYDTDPLVDDDVPGFDHVLRNNVGIDATLEELANADLASCDSSHNAWDLAVAVDAADFVSLDESFLSAPRQPDGKLPVVPLMRLVPGSDLVDAGTDVGIPFAGTAPDLGGFERDAIEIGNFDFSLPVVGATTPRPAGMVWEFEPGAGVTPQGGGQVASLGGAGAIGQACDGFEPGETYHLRVVGTATSAGAELELWIDGVPLGTRTLGPAESAVDAAFVADGSRQSLRLAATGSAGELRLSSVEITRVGATSDRDADGLPDAWEFDWFGDLAQQPSSDPDGDGSSNAVEERLALDPTSGSEAFRITQAGTGGFSWPGAEGIGFRVERSTTLDGWSEIDTVPGQAPTTHYQDPSPPDAGAFYRVAFDLP